jgi:phosphate transport system protein
MRDDFVEELGRVTFQIGWMASQVHSAVVDAVAAVETGDLRVAQRVVDGDDEIDGLMVEIEERCYEILARHQPVAGDLRFITSTLRIVVDLERCGDLAVALAKQVNRGLCSLVPVGMLDVLVRMGELAAGLFEAATQAWAHRDTALAASLEGRDDKVDALHHSLMSGLPALAGAQAPEIAAEVALAGRYVERIADHAVCIGERVGYLVKADHAALTQEVGP